MKLIFKSKQDLPGEVTRFSFAVPEGISWQPGQFIHYRLPHQEVDERGDERWFTISSAPFENEITITTRTNGRPRSSFKAALLNLQPGAEVAADVPEGDFTIDDTNKDYVFVIGGIGVTPLRSILAQLDHDGDDINLELLYANRSEDKVPYQQELEELAARHSGFKISYFYGDHHITADDLKEAASRLNNPLFYVSGPESMVESFEETLASIGVDENHSRFDYFPGYDQEV